MTKAARATLLEGLDTLSVVLDPSTAELYVRDQKDRAERSATQRYRRPVSGYKRAMQTQNGR